jgi:ParB-like chromosome segregation protein Spo0J
MQTIQIKCQGATTLPIDAILEFQGELKKLSKENLEKLKKNILLNGFIAPMFVWDDHGDYKLLDGHQRTAALISLRQDGYDIPLLPVDIIDAQDEAEARRMLLSITSQYGEFDKGQLDEWLNMIDEDIKETIRLVDGEIKMSKENNNLENSGKDNNKKSGQQKICPNCGYDFI